MSIAEKLIDANQTIKNIQEEARCLVAGRKVRIVSNFNGQPCGRSRKSLKGTVQTVKSLQLDGYHIWLFLEDGGKCWCGVGLKEVEFIDDKQSGVSDA
jgi:hypothetical protein